MAKSDAERKSAYDARKKNSGLVEKTLTFTEDTYKILLELVKKSGYAEKEIAAANLVVISKVLAQIVYEANERLETEDLSRKHQEGYIIACCNVPNYIKLNFSTYPAIL